MAPGGSGLICNLAPRLDPDAARVQAASGTGDIFGRIAAGETLVVSHGSTKADDYNWAFHLLSHPESFPNGTGFRPVGMTEEAWVALLLNRARPPNFPENPFLTADLLNILQRHQVNRWSDIRMRMDTAALQRISRMTAGDLREALELLRSGLVGAALAQRLAAAVASVRELFHSFKFVSGHVIGSPQSLAQLRSRHLGGSWLTFGPCTMSITFSPAPQHAQLVFELMGHPYTFNADGSPNRDPRSPGGCQPPFDERLRLIAQHPSACSDFFKAFVAAFAHVFLGWPPGAVEQENGDCLLGRVSCWFAKLETSQAGDLHAHWCIWQPGMDVDRVKRMLESPDATARLFSFMESVQRQWLPDPAMVAPSVGINAADPTRPPVEVAARPNEDLACEWQPNLSDAAACQRTTAEAICERCNHNHTFTCAKNGGKATHCNCRLRMPRPVCAETVACSSGLVRLKRCGAMVVPHLAALVMAQPCNNMAYFIIEASRWAREVQLYLATHPDAKADDPHLQPPDVYMTAADWAEYAIAYASKADAVDSCVLVTETLEQLREREEQRRHAPGTELPVRDPAADRGRWILAHASNVAHGAITLPLAMAAHLGSGGTYSVESHRYIVHDLRLFERLLQPPDAALPDRPIEVIPQFALRSARASPSTSLGSSDTSSGSDEDSDMRSASSSDADSGAARGGSTAASGGSDTEGSLAPGGSPSATPSTAADEPQRNPWELDPHAQLQPINAADDYIWRGADLAPFSPVLVTMWFHKAKMTDAQLDALAAAAAAASSSSHAPSVAGLIRLHPAHPQYGTHRWVLRRHPFLIQPISEPPLRPADDAPAEEREAYAAWALANFGVYSANAGGTLDLAPPYWPQFLRLVDSTDSATSAAIARRFLANADSRAATRIRGDVRRQTEAHATPEEGSAEEALAKLVPEVHFGGQEDEEAARVQPDAELDEEATILAEQMEEQTEPTDADIAASVAVEPLGTGANTPLSAEAGRRVHAAFHNPPPARKAYLVNALHCLPPQPAAAASLPAGAATQDATQTPAPVAVVPGIPAAPALLDGVSDEQLAAIAQQQTLYRNALERTPDEVDEALMAAGGGSGGANRGLAAGAAAAVVATELHLVRPSSTTVQALLTTVAANGIRNQHLFPVGSLPPYVLLPADERPSPEDTAALFTLSDDQREPFLLLAYTFLAELNGSRQPPLGMLVTGDAGTGKSRIILAMLWFGFQQRGSRLLLVTSYMWRAAMHVTTPSNIAVATTTLFALGINRRKGGRRQLTQAALAAVRARTRDVRFIFFEEYGVMGRAHWANVCNHARSVSRLIYRNEDLPDAPCGHFHTALFGDVRQHVGPKALPMLAAAPEPLVVHVRNQHGSSRALHVSLGHQGSQWLAKLQQVFYLQRQHRRDETQAAGLQLHDVAHLFDGLGNGTPQQVTHAIDQLHSRAVPNLDGLTAPRVVVLRHEVQLYLNRRLAEREAQRLGQPIYLWRSADTLASAAAVPADLAAHLEDTSYDRTGRIPTIAIFFQGIIYAFVDSEGPALHRITNNSATGVSLLLHDSEPMPPTTPGVHLLRYVPKGVVVQPEGPPLGDVCPPPVGATPVVPKGCILLPRQTRRFSVSFRGNAAAIVRSGFMLGDGYAVTDYAAQGANFGAQDWLAHLNPPDRGPISRATVFVILTRFRDWDALKLLAPLWRPDDAEGRSLVHARLAPLAAKDPPLAAELDRLHATAAEQRSRTAEQLRNAQAAAAAAAERAPH